MFDVNIPFFILSALAVWRISHLLSYEEGPFDVILRFRALLKNIHSAAKLMECMFCNSLWIAIPFALLLASKIEHVLIVILALSAVTILIQRLMKEEKAKP